MRMLITNRLSQAWNFSTDFEDSAGEMIRFSIPPAATATVENADPWYLNQDPRLRAEVFAGRIAVTFVADVDDLFGPTPIPIDHTTLLNIGTNTHAQIDVHIADAAIHMPAVLLFGAGGIGTTVTSRYLWPGYDDGDAQVSAVWRRATRAMTLRNMYVQHNIPAGNGNDVVYTVQVEGGNTALTVTLASTGTTNSDTANTAAVAAGQRYGIIVTKAASIVTSPSDVVVSLEAGS